MVEAQRFSYKIINSSLGMVDRRKASSAQRTWRGRFSARNTNGRSFILTSLFSIAHFLIGETALGIGSSKITFSINPIEDDDRLSLPFDRFV